MKSLPLTPSRTTCFSLLHELQKIWDENGESESARDKMLIQLEQECLDIYRRKVDFAKKHRADLHQSLADADSDTGRPLPKFGEWDVNDPASAEGFTVIFSKARDEKKTGGGTQESPGKADSHSKDKDEAEVYIWGEGTGEGILGTKMDSFVPKTLESTVVLDVHTIAFGQRHAILVTKQGEVFSWGEEHRGRLGHGEDSNVSHPKLVDGLKNVSVELVACGEYQSCAVTLSGDLYMWGGNAPNSELSQWVPKKLHGPLEGIHVSSVACGQSHTAVVTSAGQLFTFGDGTCGVLGHGDWKSVSRPREVDSLKGLRTVRAACGVCHTAAVVEVVVGPSSSSNCSSGKLFTWGDGYKGCLGHGDEEAKLVPTLVAALMEPNFCQVACGNMLTAALTTDGQVYSMGSPEYGQLGNPQADGKLPTRVKGKLMRNFVKELACGAYHVAVLTSKTEIYTWGMGANGRLGHGDIDDRDSPAIVEALKNKQVKSVVCGASFTAAICLHKCVSGVDQSMCPGCRIPFNFKSPNKSYHVCDSCFCKLRKGPDSNQVSAPGKDGSQRSAFNNSKSFVSGATPPTLKRPNPPLATTPTPVRSVRTRRSNDTREEIAWLKAQVEELNRKVGNELKKTPAKTAVQICKDKDETEVLCLSDSASTSVPSLSRGGHDGLTSCTKSMNVDALGDVEGILGAGVHKDDTVVLCLSDSASTSVPSLSRGGHDGQTSCTKSMNVDALGDVEGCPCCEKSGCKTIRCQCKRNGSLCGSKCGCYANLCENRGTDHEPEGCFCVRVGKCMTKNCYCRRHQICCGPQCECGPLCTRRDKAH